MPAITKKKTVEHVVGMVCDRCGKTDENGFNDFHVSHTLGYDSPFDMAVLSFSLCDDCLIEIAAAQIPGARLTADGTRSIDIQTAAHTISEMKARAHGA